VGEGEIGIEFERVLRFGHRPFHTVGHAHHEAKSTVSLGVIGGEGKRTSTISVTSKVARYLSLCRVAKCAVAPL
jgi:hypothetical protein